MDINEYLLTEINDLDKRIKKEKDKQKESLMLNDPTKFTNVNTNYLVFLEGKKDAFETLLYSIGYGNLDN